MSKFFNPLHVAEVGTSHPAVASSTVPQEMQATAAIYNEVQGECPKCKTKMVTAVILTDLPVHFCQKCRVTAPMAN